MTIVNVQGDSVALVTNSTRDTNVVLMRHSEPQADSSSADIPNEVVTSTANEQQLLLEIRRAVQLRLPLPHQLIGNHKQGGGFGALTPGLEIADCRLIKELGAGAFAKVFLAFHKSMQRLVAIKFSERSSNEPKLLSSLTHPHIVRVYHYDDKCLSQEGIYVLFMEYVPGVDLKRLIQDAASVPTEQRNGVWLAEFLAQADTDSTWRERRVLPPSLVSATWPEVVAWIGARIADALAYAHGQNVVHRDIKPANVLLGMDGSPMLVDFNVGFGEHVLGSRPEHCFGGSPAYMSPEQRNAFYRRGNIADVDGRCDIYSLGVLLCELLTGSLPDVPGGKLVISGIDAGCPPEPATARYHGKSAAGGGLEVCPIGLRDIVTGCIASDVMDRPQSADFVARRLRICSSRDLHDFVFAPVGSWAAAAASHPSLALLAVVLAPNTTFAILNIAFVERYVNHGFYLDEPPDWKVAIGYFELQKLVVNAVVFTLGICAVVWLSRLVASALPRASGVNRRGHSPAIGLGEREAAWQRANHLGYYAWTVAIGCWVGTGIVFPSWNCLAKLYYTSQALSPRDFATFMMTQVTFGTMASALSVLGVNFVLTQWLLPVLVREDPVPSASYLDSIGRQVQRMVHWLAFVPQFSLLGVALLIADRNPTLLVMLGLVSGACYACGILYGRSIRRAEARLRMLLAA